MGARATDAANRSVAIAESRPIWKKLAWMVAIWGASVAALGVVALLLRLLMHSVGLRT